MKKFAFWICIVCILGTCGLLARPVEGKDQVLKEDKNGTFSLTIRVLYPFSNLQGDALYLRGNRLGLNWNHGIKLHHPSADVWEHTISYTSSDVILSPTLEMKPLVDDKVWKRGANNIVQLSTDESSYTVEIYPWFYTSKGGFLLSDEPLYSPQLNNFRYLVIYTPASYYENTLQLMKNVLIMHDGENLFNASTSFGGIAWDCQDTVNALVEQGFMEEVLIVGVYNTADRIDEYTYSYDPEVGAGGKGDLYLDFLRDQVLPYVARFYRVEEKQPNLGILGSSLGGLISCYAGWTRPTEYSRAGCMSSSFWWNSQDFNKTILVENPKPNNMEIYLDSGTCCLQSGNDDVVQTHTVHSHMERLGMVVNQTLFYYVDVGASHNEYYWGRRFYVPMTYLYPIQPIIPHGSS